MTSSQTEAIDLGDYEFLRNEIRKMRGIIHANKVKNKIIKDYGLSLDSHEDRSLARRIAYCLLRLSDEGELSYYSKINHHRGIKYVRR